MSKVLELKVKNRNYEPLCHFYTLGSSYDGTIVEEKDFIKITKEVFINDSDEGVIWEEDITIPKQYIMTFIEYLQVFVTSLDEKGRL